MISIERLLTAIKPYAAKNVEACWSTAFSALRPLVRVRAMRLTSLGPVLVIAPHPDDEVAGACGAILEHRRAGDSVKIAIVTDGRGSRAGGLGPIEMARLRRCEADEAGRVLGTGAPIWMGLPEYGWASEELDARLVHLITEEQPRVIYAPSCVDFHPEHLRVSSALGRALTAAPGTERAIVRIYQVMVPLTPTLTNAVVDVSHLLGHIERAFSAYASQLGSLRRTFRLRRYAANLHGAPLLAEVFCEIPAQRYAAIHACARPYPSEGRGYFGVRSSPFLDPIAYIRTTLTADGLKPDGRCLKLKPDYP